jgi:hypothetical protein
MRKRHCSKTSHGCRQTPPCGPKRSRVAEVGQPSPAPPHTEPLTPNTCINGIVTCARGFLSVSLLLQLTSVLGSRTAQLTPCRAGRNRQQDRKGKSYQSHQGSQHENQLGNRQQDRKVKSHQSHQGQIHQSYQRRSLFRSRLLAACDGTVSDHQC